MRSKTWSSAAEERFVALETPFTWVRLLTIAAITMLYFTEEERSYDHVALPVMAWAWAYNLFVLFLKPHRRHLHRKTRWWTAAANVLTTVPWIAATGGLHSRFIPLLYLVVLSGSVRFPPFEGVFVTLAFVGSYLGTLLAMGQLTADPRELVFQLTFVASAGFLGMVFSVVFLQQVERRLHVSEEAVRARDELISVAGHDLRTPLNGMQLYLKLTQRELANGVEPSALASRLDLALRQVGKLTEMTGELLDISRMAAGQLSLALEQIDLGEVVRDVVARLFPPTPDAPKVAVALEGPVEGHWDRGRLEQITSNLVSNAVKYGNGNPVDVHVSQVGSTARLEVVDHGVGIPPEEQERIFARFHRVPGTHGKASGVGLGLWITRKLVDAMGGAIRVASEKGVGSTFTVELPLSGPMPA